MISPSLPQTQTIRSLDDPRVAGYRNLRERNLRDEGLFITEGVLLAERLLHSRFPVESLFVTLENAARFAGLLQGRAPLYVAEAAVMRQIVGFDFHRGVLGLGRRLPFPAVTPTVEQWARQVEKQVRTQQRKQPSACSNGSLQLIACPTTESTENLGLILRSAAAFGVQGVLLPIGGADPLSRRCLRQSMGSALSLPMACSADLLQHLCALRKSVGLCLVAAVAGGNCADNRSENTDDNSGDDRSSRHERDDGSVISLADFAWPERTVLVVGNEYHGLDMLWREQCDYQVTIPLAPGCDSLNVAVATGVFLYSMRNAMGMASRITSG